MTQGDDLNDRVDGKNADVALLVWKIQVGKAKEDWEQVESIKNGAGERREGWRDMKRRGGGEE